MPCFCVCLNFVLPGFSVDAIPVIYPYTVKASLLFFILKQLWVFSLTLRDFLRISSYTALGFVYCVLLQFSIQIYCTSITFDVLFFTFRSAGLLFFSALFVNLLTGILFLVGSNVAVICDDIPDYKLLQKVNITFLAILKALLLCVIFV